MNNIIKPQKKDLKKKIIQKIINVGIFCFTYEVCPRTVYTKKLDYAPF